MKNEQLCGVEGLDAGAHMNQLMIDQLPPQALKSQGSQAF